MKAWLSEVDKHITQRQGDDLIKQSVAYLQTSGRMSEFTRGRLHIQEAWQEFSRVLLDRYGTIQTPADAWNTLTSIKQSSTESIQSVLVWILELAHVAYTEVELPTPIAQQQLI